MSASLTIPKSYQAIVVSEAKAPFEIKEIAVRPLESHEVLVKVEACGMCHSDSFVKEGGYPLVTYPRIPGHELAGIVVQIGSAVKSLKVGDHVGRGWHGGCCFICKSCRRGDFSMCKEHYTTGINMDGGYAEYTIARWESLALLPNDLPFVEAGPLLCAGLTVFNSLRNCQIMAPAIVAVHGVGGLGHLGIQFAAKLGFEVVAISTSDEKKDLALKLGARHYINSKHQNAAQELQKLGGAKAILGTVYDAKATESLIGGLAADGVLLTLGIDPMTPLQVHAGLLVGKRSLVKGWFSGYSVDAEECCQFASFHGVKSLVEEFPLDKIDDAYKLMMSGKAKFRVVLTPGKNNKTKQ